VKLTTELHLKERLRMCGATVLWPIRRGVMFNESRDMRVYSKVSGLAAWSENCKWYSSLLLVAVVSLFCESV
jgi:hypothetical protein